MRRRETPHVPSKRNAILENDSRKDLEREVQDYHKDKELEKFAAAYFDDDQMRSFQEIAAANSLEIGSFLVLLEQDGLLPERLRSSAPAISIAEAREQSERFGVDALYSIYGFVVEHDLATPRVLAKYIDEIEHIADRSTVPFVLMLLERNEVFGSDFNQEHVVLRAGNLLMAIMNQQGRTRNSLGMRMDIADSLVRVLARHPGEQTLEPVLAMTGTTASLQYFQRTNYTPGREFVMTLHRGDFRGMPELPTKSRERDSDSRDWDAEPYDPDDWRFDRFDDDRSDDDEYDDEDDGPVRRERFPGERSLFLGDGLTVEVSKYKPSTYRQHAIEMGLPDIHENAMIGRIDFTPEGHTSYSPERRTEFLLTGYKDFKAYFQAADEGLRDNADYFIGTTNREMAQAALILGFHLGDQEYGYTVYAKAEDIRTRLAELGRKQFRGGSFIEKMAARAERLADHAPRRAA
jgi:hypothetical protein